MGKNRGKRRGGKTDVAAKAKSAEEATPKVSPAAEKKVKQPKPRLRAGQAGNRTNKTQVLSKSKVVLSAGLAARLGTRASSAKKSNTKIHFDARSIIEKRDVPKKVPNQAADLRLVLGKNKDRVKSGKSQAKPHKKPKIMVTVNNQNKVLKIATAKRLKKAQKTATSPAKKLPPTVAGVKVRKNIVVQCSFPQGSSPPKQTHQIEFSDNEGKQYLMQQDRQQTFTWQLPTNGTDSQSSDPFKPVLRTYVNDPQHPNDSLMAGDALNKRSSLPAPRGTLPPPRDFPAVRSATNLGLYNPQLWLDGQNNPFRTMHPNAAASALAAPKMPLGAQPLPDDDAKFFQTGVKPEGNSVPRSFYKVGVSNLHSGVDINDLYELFGDVGVVLSVELLASGVAEVSFATYREVAQAIEVYHQRLLDNQPLYVEYLGQVSL